MDEVIAFARNEGYNSAVYVCKWRGYDVYKPTFNNGLINIVGIPVKILVRDNEIRMSTEKETFEYLDEHK